MAPIFRRAAIVPLSFANNLLLPRLSSRSRFPAGFADRFPFGMLNPPEFTNAGGLVIPPTPSQDECVFRTSFNRLPSHDSADLLVRPTSASIHRSCRKKTNHIAKAKPANPHYYVRFHFRTLYSGSGNSIRSLSMIAKIVASIDFNFNSSHSASVVVLT